MNKNSAPALLLAPLSHVFDQHMTETLAFRPLARADAFALFNATATPSFNKYLRWAAPKTMSDLMPQVDKLLRDQTLGHLLALSVIDKTTGQWRGAIILKPYKEGVEVTVWLHPGSWNKGVVTTATRTVIELVQHALPQASLYVRCHVDNKKTQRLCLHYGFVQQEQTVNLTHEDGSNIVCYELVLDKSKWVPCHDGQPY